MAIIGYEFADGNTVCNDCITSDEEQTEIAIYLDEYHENIQPHLIQMGSIMTGEI